jgi:hypothetical protein
MSDPKVYATTYCNKGHRISDGMPVNHECYVLPPAALRAERDGDIPRAIDIIQAAKPLRVSRVRMPKENPIQQWLVAVSYAKAADRVTVDRALASAVGKRPNQVLLQDGVVTVVWAFGTERDAFAARDRLQFQGVPHIRIFPRGGKPNPINSNTRVLITGVALVGVAIGIASLLVVKKATATTTTTTVGQAVSLVQSDAGSAANFVNVGDTVTISLEANASQGFGYPAPKVTGSSVLGPAVRSASATGISDTFPVIAAGTAAITYTESSPSSVANDGVGSAPITFFITAT